MRLSHLFTVLSLALSSAALAFNDGSTKGGLLLVDTDKWAKRVPYTSTQKKPVQANNGNGLQNREPVVIEGLLRARQFGTCDSGFKACGVSACCPVGEECCLGKLPSASVSQD